MNVIGKIYLKGTNVTYGKNIKIYGIPLITMQKGSKIKLGNEVVLRSLSTGNAIGVNHEVILRTSTSQAHIIIGDNFGMSGGAICAINRVEIGDNVMIGSNTVIADNDFHGITLQSRKAKPSDLPSEPIFSENGVWIGADVYVCKGVTIGKNSVIGAKSVVTKSIPPNSLVAGVPARVISSVKDF